MQGGSTRLGQGNRIGTSREVQAPRLVNGRLPHGLGYVAFLSGQSGFGVGREDRLGKIGIGLRDQVSDVEFGVLGA